LEKESKIKLLRLKSGATYFWALPWVVFSSVVEVSRAVDDIVSPEKGKEVLKRKGGEGRNGLFQKTKVSNGERLRRKIQG
jgi:hypothetical protein